jgi:flagellar basal-body rod modification protein FlgD
MTTTSGANNSRPVVSGTTAQSSSSNSNSAAGTNALANQQIAGNFQSFLTLLTTQLQNQNPLSPLDTNQFTQQLVEFAGVQQQINTNDALTSLVSLQLATATTQALEFVGKTAVVAGDTAALANGQASWGLNVPSDSTVTVTIKNSTGATVFTQTLQESAGKNQPFTWNGVGTDGTKLPAGNYTISASAKDAAGNVTGISTQIQGEVSSIDLTQTPPLLTIGGQSFTLGQIISIMK